MKEKIEEVPIVETMKLNQEKKKRNIPWGWILLILFVLVECWFFITWNQQQKVADMHMDDLLGTVVLTEEEELTDAEVASLYENYGNDTWTAEFQEEQTAIFLDRMTGVYGMSLKEAVLSMSQGEEAFLQLCFICEFEDNISGPVFYAYRYYETGRQMKYICYEYDTVKSKLFWEEGNGLTIRYDDVTKRIDVSSMTLYDAGLYDIVYPTNEK